MCTVVHYCTIWFATLIPRYRTLVPRAHRKDKNKYKYVRLRTLYSRENKQHYLPCLLLPSRRFPSSPYLCTMISTRPISICILERPRPTSQNPSFSELEKREVRAFNIASDSELEKSEVLAFTIASDKKMELTILCNQNNTTEIAKSRSLFIPKR